MPEHLRILVSDVRYSTRVWLKSPGFVLTALFAIVLGVSATTTVFSLINAVLIRPLPYKNAQRLVYMWTPSPNTAGLPRERQPFYGDIATWRDLSHSFENITALRRYIALLSGVRPEHVGAANVLGNFFQTLGAAPELGRAIDANDDHPGKQFVVVISDGVWHSRFGGDPAVLGKSVQIDRQSYQVIGVMGREFSYPHGTDFPGQYQFASLPRTDIWLPAALTLKQQAQPDYDDFDAAIGRLRPGVSQPQAQSEISSIERRLEPLHPEGWRDLQALLVPFVETTIGPVRPLLRLLMGAVSLVLLMACANFAGLLTARAADSVHEIGVRMALGAQRSRLIRTMLTESLMLTMTGGALATLASFAALRIVAKWNPDDIPRFEAATIDMRVLLFALFVSIVTGLAAGIFPALLVSFEDAGAQLREGGRAIAGTSCRSRNVLIIGQVAISVVLLAGAGVLVRSYLAVLKQDDGFSQTTLTMSVNLDDQTKNANQIRRELMDRICDLPGVQVAGSIDDLPLSTYEDKGFLEVDGYVAKRKETVSVRETGGDYFQAMQIPLIAGRYLRDSDVRSATPAAYPYMAVVSEGFARRYFAGRNAVGHRLRINGSPWSTIAGVVGDVRHSSLEEAPEPIVYYQNGLVDSVAVRTIAPPATVIRSIRKVVDALAPGGAVTDVQTMNKYVDEAAARRRFQSMALTSFAGVAMLLTLVGLYGLLSYAVRQRTPEIGVRMAVGATQTAVIGMIVSYGLRLTGAGLAIGVCLAFALTRAMAGFLYAVDAADPATFLFVPALVIVVAVVVCIGPAWRAARIEPLRALRHGAN
ncbi:MAG TPA: ABC transporter permease [Bryobacteraceae bacterium]|nr:ABC transporter permease [Bryobacteraceae bacterium]